MVLLNNSCKKTRTLTTGGTLNFSVDTLKFDTVFTAEGSFTTGLLIYNPQDEEVILSSVRLQDGAASYFHLNVDGFPGNNIPNLKIAAHDSLYVFATVTIDPNNTLTPFIITDSLVATLNGKNFYVPFTAYGQNAHYIIDSVLTTDKKGNSTIFWNDSLPYVIINSAQINPGTTLKINPGTRVYMHQNSGLVVLGTLQVNGTATDTVIFQGDRLDRVYFGYMGYPGEWGGIYFGSHSSGSILSYTRIENCGNGALSNVQAAIVVYTDSSVHTTADPLQSPQLFMNNCIVENSYGYGIYSFQGTVVAVNCLVNTTGQQALAVVQGGYDSMVNCTFANYGTAAVTHANSGTVAILDYYWDGVPGDPTYYSNLNASFINCIVYGSLDSEATFDTSGSPAGTSASLLLDHCLLKTGTVIEKFVTTNPYILNQDPLFIAPNSGNFDISSGSPAIGKGNPAFAPMYNLENKAWHLSVDIGCY